MPDGLQIVLVLAWGTLIYLTLNPALFVRLRAKLDRRWAEDIEDVEDDDDKKGDGVDMHV